MLRYLKIRDFALIRNLEIEFGDGLTVLTGETGSGKSIIVDALGLLTGGRSSPDLVRTDCPFAVLEGVFSPGSTRVAEQLAAAGIGMEEETLLVRREITAAGRGRIFINNSLATLTLLKTIGTTLADIHGQQEHQALLDLSTHLRWLDRFGGNAAEAREVRSRYERMHTLAQELDALETDEQERQRQLDILRFQADEIRRAGIRPGEKEELENERSVLGNREKVFALASEAYGLLYESENALTGQADRLARILQELAEFDRSWEPHLQGLRETLYRLEDVAYAARDYAGSIDFSPERLDQVERRLAELDRLGTKYGPSMEQVAAFGLECAAKLEGLENSQESAVRIAAELDGALKEYLERAGELSLARHRNAARLEREIRKEFHALAMDTMELTVRFGSRERTGGAGPGRMPPHCGPEGVDQVEFLLAPNPGEETRPLARIASGGELSRIMLAVKTLCGGDEAGKTLVFDEIDAGIGGRVAEVIGRRLREMSARNQVFCVTHLPQIAAFASEHFSVMKESVGERTETRIRRLSPTDRVAELARMMGGEVITETTRRHAREMLEHAGRGIRKESRANHG